VNLLYLVISHCGVMTCRHYVICFTERDRQSRWSVAYPAACMCWAKAGHHFEHLLYTCADFRRDL